MATKDSIMKQSIFFWVFGHRLSFEHGLKKFLFGAWRNLSGALRELILKHGYMEKVTRNPSILKNPIFSIPKTVSNFHVFVFLAFQLFVPLLQILFVAMGKQQIPTLDVYIVLQSLELYEDVKISLTSKIVVLESFYCRVKSGTFGHQVNSDSGLVRFIF